MIHDHQLNGIGATKSSDLTVNGNIVSWIRPANEPEPAYMVWEGSDPEIGGIVLTSNEPFTMNDNIVAGAWHVGMKFPARKCGDPAVYTGNVAHSISGYGAIVDTPASETCNEFSDFKGYKTRIATVHMGGGLKSALNKVHDIVSVDSAVGLMAFGSGSARVEVEDSIFYGAKDMENEDCPEGGSCAACISKKGIWMPTFGGHLTGVSLAPKLLGKMYAGGGSWGGSSLYRRITF